MYVCACVCVCTFGNELGFYCFIKRSNLFKFYFWQQLSISSLIDHPISHSLHSLTSAGNYLHILSPPCEEQTWRHLHAAPFCTYTKKKRISMVTWLLSVVHKQQNYFHQEGKEIPDQTKGSSCVKVGLHLDLHKNDLQNFISSEL